MKLTKRQKIRLLNWGFCLVTAFGLIANHDVVFATIAGVYYGALGVLLAGSLILHVLMAQRGRKYRLTDLRAQTIISGSREGYMRSAVMVAAAYSSGFHWLALLIIADTFLIPFTTYFIPRWYRYCEGRV